MNKAAEVSIVNYGMGNIQSIVNALGRLSVTSQVIHHPEQIEQSNAFILPGVGAFAVAMENLQQNDMLQALTQAVRVDKKPLLGICLGLQLLAEYSDEHGRHQGLGWIDAKTIAMTDSDNYRLPHVGWNNVEFKEHFLFRNVSQQGHFYFDHSFRVDCDASISIAQSEYGHSFVAGIQQDNIMGTQFHPEKSQRNGLQVLANYIDFIRE